MQKIFASSKYIKNLKNFFSRKIQKKSRKFVQQFYYKDTFYKTFFIKKTSVSLVTIKHFLREVDQVGALSTINS